MTPPALPTLNEFERGYLAFQKYEKRDAMYKIASFLVNHFWGNPADIANGLGVLLLTWNQAFYRYGPFDFIQLENYISKNDEVLTSYRARDIISYSSSDYNTIESLFNELHLALQVCQGKKKGTKSPVAVSKALHLLAPYFFPLWDNKIAIAYECRYTHAPAKKYILFMGYVKELAKQFHSNNQARGTGKTLLKLIDEYNYAKYTRGWI